MATKRPIPSVPFGTDSALAKVLQAQKENLEIITGQRGDNKVAKLDSTATTAQIIAKINEIIAVLQ
jgi:hypothetical protein